MQLAYVLLQRRQTIIGILEGFFLGKQLVIARLGAGFSLASFCTRDTHLILGFHSCHSLVFDLCGDLARHLLPAGIIASWGLRCAGRQFPAVGVPVSRLCDNNFLRFSRRNCFKFGFLRHRQNLAALQTVHVAAIKSFLVGAQQSDQHLVQRDTLLLIRRSDLAQVVALLDLVGIGTLALHFSGRFCLHFCLGPGSRFRCGHASFRNRGRRKLHCRRLGFRHHDRCRLDCYFRGVKKKGVFANEPPCCPIELQQHIDKRFVQRAVRTQLDDRLATWPLVDNKTDTEQYGGVIQSGRLERIRRGQAGLHACQLFTGCGKFDLCTQGLAQCGENRHFPEPGSLHRKRQARQGETGRNGQCRGTKFVHGMWFLFHGATLSVEYGLLK